MTFYDISIKMLRVNIKRYKLYFACNMLSVALFYCFAAIFTNELFMNQEIVDPMISSNILAPSVFVGVFLVFFLPYSYRAFLRKRKQEYGILMSLGMSETQILQNMLIENFVIAGISFVMGSLIGTIISFVFYYIIQHVIGISGLYWYFNPMSYIATGLLYGATILLTSVLGICGFVKMQITDLIKEKFKAEKQRKPIPLLFFVGLLLIIAAVWISTWKQIDDLLLINLIMMFAGSFLMISNAKGVKIYTTKIFDNYNKQHMIELSFVRQHHKSRSRIGVIASWLIGISIFLAGLTFVLYSMKSEVVYSYTPYDMVFSKIFGMNQVDDSKVERLLKENDVSVKSLKQVSYLRGNAFNLLPVSEVNNVFRCNYQIPEGSFMTVFQYNLRDGYVHDMFAPRTISLDCGNDELELDKGRSNIKILFNRNPTFADQTIVLNDTDYDKISSSSKKYWPGTMMLYQFDDWKDSQKGINAVQKYLLNQNHIDSLEQKHYYRATSRIDTYTTDKQSCQFLIFLMCFVVILFCGAADIMIHFNIKAESEEEQGILSGLYRMGVTEEEMSRIIHHKNVYYYLPQVILGIFIGAFYNYVLNKTFGYGLISTGYCFVIGSILVFLQLSIIQMYSKRELCGFCKGNAI